MQIPENWSFDNAEVAAGFDKHVREQLPWYDIVTDSIVHIARHYIPQGGLIYDIGCSTGNISNALSDVITARNASIVGIENSKKMVEQFKGKGTVEHADAVDFEYKPFDVAILYLTMMFIPVSFRTKLLATLAQQMRAGGAIIIVDKVLPQRGYTSIVLSRMALAQKVSANVPAKEILSKELSLSGVQRPIDPAMLGANAVEFFRLGDFAGWIIEK